jgi:hypothetical protein
LNRGHCRCTRTAEERDIDEAFLPKQGGDYAEFQAWACINWHKKGPLYIHEVETKEERQVSLNLIDAENKNNKEEYRKKWEAGQAMLDLGRTRTRRGKPPTFEVFWTKSFKLGRKCDGNGVDWFLHQFRILRPLFIPFIKEIQAKYAHGRDVHIIEDGASAHWCNANNLFWTHIVHQFREDWPPYSPDLNPIEKIWSWIKQHIPYTTSHDQLKEYWHQAWNDLPQEVIQHAIERMEWVVKKVIAMKGDNKYDEKRPKEVSEKTSRKYGSKR